MNVEIKVEEYIELIKNYEIIEVLKRLLMTDKYISRENIMAVLGLPAEEEAEEKA